MSATVRIQLCNKQKNEKKNLQYEQSSVTAGKNFVLKLSMLLKIDMK